MISKNDSKHTINIGKIRVKRINRYRAQQHIEGNELTSIEKAVNHIIDKFLTNK